MKKPILPPPAEWDFRGVPDYALADATLWEYARTSDRVRQTAIDWLSGGQPLKRFLGAIDSGREVWRLHRLAELLTARPDFPAPWTAKPVLYDKIKRGGYSFLGDEVLEWGLGVRTHVEPIAGFCERVGRRCAEDGRPFEAANLGGCGFFVKVDWQGATIEEIIEDFEKWARCEAKNHTGELRPRGKAGQPPIEPLKCLAAWRLRRAGLTYDAAQAVLDVYRNPGDLTAKRRALNLGVPTLAPTSAKLVQRGKLEILPIFNNPASWSEAITSAKRRLAETEANLPSNPT